MVTTSSIRSLILGVAFVLACIPTAAQQKVHPENSNRTSTQKPSLLDFALKGINKSDRDYGQCIDESRRLLLEATIENGYFWSNVASIVVLCCFFLGIVYQRKVQVRRELMVAESLNQYRNALARAEKQNDEAVGRNRELMEALSAAIQMNTADVSGQAMSGGGKKAAPKSTARAESTAPVPGSGANQKQHDAASARGPIPENRESVKQAGEVDLVSKVTAMQQQIALLQEREKQLRRQLNDAELRVQREQERNRNLKDT